MLIGTTYSDVKMSRAKQSRRPLPPELRQVWWDAFLGAFRVALAKDGTTLTRSFPAVIRLSKEAADAALTAYCSATGMRR